MGKTIVSRTLSVHQEHELLVKLESAGLTKQLAQKIIDSKNNCLAERMVKFITGNDGLISENNQQRAREIMGKNFFGIEQAVQHFGVTPTEEQLKILSEIPFSEAVLQETKDSHVLVAVFPLSILEVREMVKGKGLFFSQDWYDNQKFAQDKGVVGWMLIRKTSVPNSTNKTWEEQLALLTKEEVPTAQAMVYTIIGHYLATDERLFENIWVRTSSTLSLGSDGRCVGLGGFDTDGLGVFDDWDSYCYDNLAVSSSRKS